MKKKTILVTGGAGYIGAHMAHMLLEAGYMPVVFDNLSTGHRTFVPHGVPFVKGDLRNLEDLVKTFKQYKIDAVMHFAAKLVVPESVAKPLEYYENNVTGSLNLVRAMLQANVTKLIFSSTAAVYGEPSRIPVTEEAPTIPTNPYGQSKLLVEMMLKDISHATPLTFISLRYFNVAGSRPQADIGIRHKEITHLIPSVLQVASGQRKELIIFGDDYDTKDGTCIRDYIYVMDLCEAHLFALEAIDDDSISDIINLGSSDGFSVKEVVDVARKVTGKSICVKIGARRPGDPGKIVASYKKAKKVLGWQPKASLEHIVQTSWKWELAELQKK